MVGSKGESDVHRMSAGAVEANIRLQISPGSTCVDLERCCGVKLNYCALEPVESIRLRSRSYARRVKSGGSSFEMWPHGWVYVLVLTCAAPIIPRKPLGAQRLSVESNALKHMIGELHSIQYSRAF